MVIRFPQERRLHAVGDYRPEPAVILILPVIRIEMMPEAMPAFEVMKDSFAALFEVLE